MPEDKGKRPRFLQNPRLLHVEKKTMKCGCMLNDVQPYSGFMKTENGGCSPGRSCPHVAGGAGCAPVHLPFFRHDGQAPEFEELTRRGPPYIQTGPERKGVLHPGGGTPEPGPRSLEHGVPRREASVKSGWKKEAAGSAVNRPPKASGNTGNMNGKHLGPGGEDRFERRKSGDEDG